MKKNISLMIVMALPLLAGAEYVETIQNVKLEKDLVKDYGMVDDGATSDQSAKLQAAINEVSAQGGGKLFLPKGTYSFNSIYLNSNVHLFVDKDVLIRPFQKFSPQGNCVFNLTVQSENRKGAEGFIENTSIRCAQPGEYFTIDYSHIPNSFTTTEKVSARAFKCVQVRNFLIEGLYVKDNWTTHCAGIFVPAKVPGCDQWEVYKPTAGLIRNFKSTNSSPGYGLAQLHAGYDLHFENLATSGGGITFRLETGAGGYYGGVDQISAENITCENGATPMAMGPHTALNGMVTAKNIRAVSCGTAFQCGPGFVDGRENRGKPGRFADGCLIENIHAVYGTNAPVSLKAIGELSEAQLNLLWWDKSCSIIRGPSRWVARDRTGDSWSPVIKKVTFEGFPKGTVAVMVADKEPRKDYRAILKNYPIWNDLPGHIKAGQKKPKKEAKKADAANRKNRKKH